MKSVNPIRKIKKIEDIEKLIDNKRNLLLFVMGINTASRVSDLLKLKLGDVTDEQGEIRPSVTLREQKTGKTKEFPLNAAVRQALTAYLDERRSQSCLDEWKRSGLDSPLFLSRKGRKSINREPAWRIFHDLGRRVGLEKIGTHRLRKT